MSVWVSLQRGNPSLEEMRKRDKLVDFPGAAIIEDTARFYPSFWINNHPTMHLVYEYLMVVLDAIGLQYEFVDVARVKDPLHTYYDIVGVHDIICENYNLPYRASQTWRMKALEQKFITISDLVNYFYNAYDRTLLSEMKISSPVDMVAFLKASPSLHVLIKDNNAYPNVR